MANTTVDAAGHAGIPANASAMMVAVNVIDHGGPGLVGIGAVTGESSGGFIFDTGDAVQASFITPLSESGTINVNTWAATEPVDRCDRLLHRSHPHLPLHLRHHRPAGVEVPR